MAEEIPVRVTPPDGNPMRGDLTDAEIAARNVLPVTNPAGEAIRNIKENHITENKDVVSYRKPNPNEPGPAAGEPLKPGVLREVQKITDRLGHKVTKDDPEYWGIASVMTEEEAAVTKHMKVRVPMTFSALQSATGLAAPKLQELLDSMSVKGIIEYNWENAEREKQYVLPMFVPGSAEFTVRCRHRYARDSR